MNSEWGYSDSLFAKPFRRYGGLKQGSLLFCVSDHAGISDPCLAHRPRFGCKKIKK
jgi:hypothetical protein